MYNLPEGWSQEKIYEREEFQRDNIKKNKTIKQNTLRQVTFSWHKQGVIVGIAYEPKGRSKWSHNFYSLDNGKYTKLPYPTYDLLIIDYTGVYYRKVMRRINCKFGTEY